LPPKHCRQGCLDCGWPPPFRSHFSSPFIWNWIIRPGPGRARPSSPVIACEGECLHRPNRRPSCTPRLGAARLKFQRPTAQRSRQMPQPTDGGQTYTLKIRDDVKFRRAGWRSSCWWIMSGCSRSRQSRCVHDRLSARRTKVRGRRAFL
jgi:hypothetical protein